MSFVLPATERIAMILHIISVMLSVKISPKPEREEVIVSLVTYLFHTSSFDLIVTSPSTTVNLTWLLNLVCCFAYFSSFVAFSSRAPLMLNSISPACNKCYSYCLKRMLYSWSSWYLVLLAESLTFGFHIVFTNSTKNIICTSKINDVVH